MKERLENMQMYSIVGIFGILVYLNSLPGHFVHDDLPAIVYNRDVLGTSSIFEMLLNDFWGMRMKLKESHKSYRPLTTLTFRWVQCFFFLFLISLFYDFLLLNYFSLPPFVVRNAWWLLTKSTSSCPLQELQRKSIYILLISNCGLLPFLSWIFNKFSTRLFSFYFIVIWKS